ncbi:MAG: prenyltransferase/squalene oxidase repeat-containing protein [Planctomycetaceae bacterium]
MMFQRYSSRCLVLITALFVSAGACPGQQTDLNVAREQAIGFLKGTQSPDGSWTKNERVGVTGLVVASLLHSGLEPNDSLVASGLKNLLSHQKSDGGVYAEDSQHRNYETCITVMALSAANTDGHYDKHIQAAETFLRGLQWDEGEGIETSDPKWGGGGYGGHQRPDLSNTQFLVEALKSAGVKEDDPAMQNILVFVSRTQNLESPANDTLFAGKINDGGFYYTPAAGGDSKAGTTKNGGLRSYGSMTYAGLKSLIYAGLDESDPRVQAAQQWIANHYTLSENPGMGQQGLYYYFHTFGRTMNVLGHDQFTDASGTVHDWKAELAARLISLQQPNGSWQNPADRWYEGDPNLVTAYCLMALSYCD